jgi:Mycothiol maleylpyruvate isomerase N-terminal domain
VTLSATPGNELAEQLEASWERLRSAVAQLSELDLERTTTAGWTAKEMLGHLAFWEEATEPVITAMFRSQQLPAGWVFGSGYVSEDGDWPTAEVHNAREAAWARGQAATTVLARLDSAHARGLAIAGTFTSDELADPRFQNYIADKCREYDGHLPEVVALLQ